MRTIAKIILFLLLAFPQAAGAQQERTAESEGASAIPEGPERIVSFHSDIEILNDGTIDVTEHISVLALNVNINRGIMREIPTIYADRSGRRVLVPFELVSVLRDGQPEPYSRYPLDNGVGLRIGSPSVWLGRGVHDYSIRYRMQRQLGRMEDWDELYWNVTGNAWEFGIDSASCSVSLPAPVQEQDIRLMAYTGAFGSRGNVYTADFVQPGLVRFESTVPLRMFEGLTIVVGFPKGIVDEVPPARALGWWLESNGSWLFALLATLLVLAYYFTSWLRVGRDPSEGLVLREERPLIGLNSAKLRFIWRRDVDNTLMTAMMLELAQQGHIKVRRGKGRQWTLLRTAAGRGGLQPEEKAFLETLFRKGYKEFELDSDNAYHIRLAGRRVEEELVSQLHHVYYEMNAAQRSRGIWLSLGLFTAYLFMTGSSRYFFNAQDFFLFMLALLAVNILFFIIMPAYTELGRAVLDRIEGFRLAMMGGEDSLGNYEHADEVLQESYLPYAVALGVNTEWVIALRTALMRRSEAPRQPGWLSGSTGSYMSDGVFDYIRFGSAMPRDLSRQYSKASHPPPPPPSSSSGSGGSTSSGSWGSSSGSGFSSSGSSGGGGGGGGGRGW